MFHLHKLLLLHDLLYGLLVHVVGIPKPAGHLLELPLIVLFLDGVFAAEIVIVVAFSCGITCSLCGEGALLGAGGFLSKDK